MKRIPTLILFMFVYTLSFAQLSTHEQPVSFTKGLRLVVKKRSATPVATMPQLEMAEIAMEDKEDEKHGIPPRIGYQHRVNYNLHNSGTWYELSNGDKLWQLRVVCPEALAVSVCFDQFWIPEGGKCFVYSTNKQHSIGAFTSNNNKGDRDDLRGFVTELVYGSDVIIEYYQPSKVTTEAIISIDNVIHGYRYINFDEQTSRDDDCMVNINCEEGQDWQYEKNAVGKILILNQGFRSATGGLLNATSLSQTPFFLTANHVIKGAADAVNDSIIDRIVVYWNYEASGCINNNTNPSYTTSGAIVIANDMYSDFALLKLIEDPQELTNYIPYYLGWDHSSQSGAAGVCIHHPHGKVKKISTVSTQPISTYVPSNPMYDNTHWEVGWASTLNGHGVTVTGSSGSPLINAAHRVIGQLHGGTCIDCNHLNGHSWFGKFNVSWMGYNNDSIQRRMNCWLDSINCFAMVLEGLLVIPEIRTITTDQHLYSNILIKNTGQLTIQGEVELMGYCRVIVETGGKLIIDGGTLSNVDLILQPGSSLRITNGGIIETRNGFDAPVGALVEILNGQIT